MLEDGKKIRIWSIVMTSLVIVGVFPALLFPLEYPVNFVAIFYLAALILVTRIFFEIWKFILLRAGREVASLLRVRLLVDTFLIAFFLFFFEGINGPLFFLYFLIICEALRSDEIFLTYVLIFFMGVSTTIEFSWLVISDISNFNFSFLVGYFFRILALVTFYSYATFISEKDAHHEKVQEDSRKTILKLKRLGKQIKKTNQKLKEISHLKDEFVSVASHELRAPMTTIKGYISMVMEGTAGKIPAKAKEYLNDAFDGNERMIRLVNNMLNVSQIESGQMVVHLVDIRLEELIESIVEEYRSEARKHGLQLKFFRPPRPLSKVRVDQDRIREVIINLINNGINFTPHGHIYIRSYQEDGLVTIEVEDTGVGIALEDQKQLFKKFSQIEVGVPLKKGSGLGLYICKMLINEFGGDIWVKSRVGKGTSFYFTLPAVSSK